MKISERFLKYVSFDTQSDETSTTIPSTAKQKVLGKYLVEEMLAMGIKDAHINDMGYVYGTIPATTKKELPVIGFIAHMDTAPDASGKDIKARIVENYDGEDIILNKEKNIVMTTKEFGHLKKYVGQNLIVTDGTTLLGADNKAGVAEILSMAEYFIANPEIEHGTIKIGFTPDEEIGCGADHFDVESFGAQFAYTVDGGELGELEYENFNAAGAKIVFNGISIHPGSAKGSMVNASLLAMEFHSMLPVFENPAYTEGYEGFSHLSGICGKVERAESSYIIRDHDKEKFLQKKERFQKIANYMNDKYGAETVVLTLKDSYYNMKEKIMPHFHLIENACKAYEMAGIKPDMVPVRGGTDGARLSYMGLPCPNICTGGHNYHGRYEYIPIEAMEKCVEILINIVKVYTTNK